MLNILVVDDSKSARNRVVKTLDNLKLDCNIVATAEDGVDALKKYLQFKPNLVITDIEMPNMDGAELISNLKKLNNSLPIVAITSLVNEKIKQTLMAYQLVYVVHKPIDVQLLSVILIKFKNELQSVKGEE